MFVVGASVTILAVAVVLIDEHGVFHWYWVGLLHWDGNVLLDVHGVGPVNWHLDWYRHGSLDLNWNVLVYWVRFWHWYFHGDGHRLLNMDWVRPVYWNVHGVGNWLLNWYSDWHWLFNGVRSRYVHWVRPVDGNLDGVTDVFNNWVGLGYGYLNFDGVWHVFLNGVGLRYGHLDGVRNVLFYWVRLRHQNLDGVGPVDWYVNGVGHFLLYWVGSWYMYGNLDVFLNVNGYMFDDLVRLRYGDLYRVGYVFLDRVRYVLFDWYGDWDSLDKSDGSGNISVTAKVDSVARDDGAMGKGSFIKEVISASDSMATADISYIKTTDSISVSQVQKTTFVQLLLEAFSLLFCRLLLAGSYCCYQQKN